MITPFKTYRFTIAQMPNMRLAGLDTGGTMVPLDDVANDMFVIPGQQSGSYNLVNLYNPVAPLSASFGQSRILYKQIDVQNKEFNINFDYLDDGLVAINNHDRSFVMTAWANDTPYPNQVTAARWGFHLFGFSSHQRWAYTEKTQ